MASRDHRPEHHGASLPIAFGPDIWIVEGPAVVAAAGFRYPTRIALIRLADGGVFVWSPVALDESLRAAVDAIGSVRCIVAPNTLHHLFVGAWKAAYPDATVFAAPGLRARQPALPVDTELTDDAPQAWRGQIDQVVVRGNRITTEIVFLHRASGTVIVTDLLQQLPTGWFTGWRRVVARLDLMTAPVPAVPRKFRMAFTDRSAARAAIGRVLRWPAERLLMAHGEPVTSGARETLRTAFRWLLPG